MTEQAQLSHCAAEARRYDPDRFLAALFAPPPQREALCALYAFNHEIAKIPDLVTEPILGAIRLQWWREALADLYRGDTRGNVLLVALRRAIETYGLSRVYFERLIEARDHDIEGTPPATMVDLERYAEESAACLAWLALEVLGVGEHEAARTAARHIGVAWALTGLLRATPYHLAGRRRSYIPVDLLSRYGLSPADLKRRPPPAELRAAVREIATRANDHLAAARQLRSAVPTAALPVLLPATLASAYLRRLSRSGHDVFAPCHRRRIATAPLRMAWRYFCGSF